MIVIMAQKQPIRRMELYYIKQPIVYRVRVVILMAHIQMPHVF